MKKFTVFLIVIIMAAAVVACGEETFEDTYFTVAFCGENVQRVETVVKKDDAIAKPQDPACEGCTFLYWATVDGVEYDFTLPVTEDIELYAVWADPKHDVRYYTVRFFDADGNMIGVPQLVAEGKSAVCPPTTTSDFFTFVGWDKDFSAVTEDMDIYECKRYNGIDPALFTYELNADSTYSISGLAEGASLPQMSGGYVKLALPTEYNGTAITSIADGDKYEGVFSRLKILSVYIPACYTKIGAYAFYGNSALMQVNFNEGLVEIGEGAFMATLGEGNVFDIDGKAEAEAYSSALTYVKLPASLKKIGAYAFNHIGCGFKNGVYMMQNVNVEFASSGNLTEIGDYAFEGAMLMSVKLPSVNNKITIGKYAFAADTYYNEVFSGKKGYPISKLTSITLPSTVGEIGDYAFYGAGNNYAFYDDTYTGYSSAISFSASALKLDYLGEYAFYGAKLNGSLKLRVKKISDYAFYGQMLSDITLDSVMSIGDYAFGRNDGEMDAQINLGDGLVSLGEGAFMNNVGLGSVVLPGSLGRLGKYAFSGCTSLSGAITLPTSLSEVEEGAFAKSGVEYVNIRGAVAFGPRCFENSALKSVSGTVLGVSEGTFADCKNLTAFTLPAGMSKVPSRLFSGCELLELIKLPLEVGEIGSYAFFDCNSLKDIVVPENVKLIKEGAFAQCMLLKDVTFDGENLTRIDAESFAYCPSLEKIKLPDSVAEIGDYAFCGSGLTTFTTPAALKTMGQGVFEERIIYVQNNNGMLFGNISGIVGDKIENFTKISMPKLNSFVISAYTGEIKFNDNGTFAGSKLSRFEVEAGNEVYSAKDGILYSRDQKRLVLCFRDDSATHIVLPDGLEEICDRAFMGNVFVYDIDFPLTLKKIGDYAFYDCKSLLFVGFSNKLTEIGKSAFAYDSGIKSINLPSSLVTIGDYAFYAAHNLETLDLSRATHLAKIGDYAFSGDLSDAPKIKSLDFTNCLSLTGTGVYAFANCSQLTSIKFGNLTKINSGSFADCSGLVDLTIGEKIKEIDSSAFRNCAMLTNIVIPEQNVLTNIRSYAFAGYTNQKVGYKNLDFSNANNMISIGDYAFAFSNVESVVLPNAMFTMGDDVFNSCTRLTSVDFGEGVIYIGANMFRYCTSLKEISLPSSVNLISKDAFRDLGSLVKVTIGTEQNGNNIYHFGKNAFFNCTNLKEVHIYGSAPTLFDDSDNYSFHYDSNSIMRVNKGVTIYIDGGKMSEYVPSGSDSKGWKVYKDLIKER